MSSVLKATIENKTTSVTTTHFKKVTTRNNVFIVSVIVYCFYPVIVLQSLHQMFNVSALLLDDALKPASPLTNGAVNETLDTSLDISQGSVATHLRCGGIFTDKIITNFLQF